MSSDLYAISLLPDSVARKEAIIQWQKNLDIVDYYNFSESLNKVLSVIKDFLLDTMEVDLDAITLVQTVLLIYQMILLIVVFTLAWAKFLRFVVEEMAQIRSIL